MAKKFLFLITLLFLCSCTLYHVDSRDTTYRFYPPKKSAGEVVYLEQIDQEYELIGVVTVNAERRQYLSEVLRKIKYEAAILGGDAVTNIKTDASGEWKALPAQKFLGNAFIRANFTADVVVFKKI